MSLYGMENFAYGTVAATFGTGDTSFSMSSGHTARFTTFPCMAVLYNITDYNSPHEAFYEGASADAEIIEIVSKSGDTFDVVKRGQDGTSAISTTSGKTYRIAVIASRSQWDKVCRAEPDGTGPFDAILAGTAGAVTEALARFVKDVSTEDAVVSVQGSDTASDKTSLWLGDVTTPNDVRLERLQAATRSLSLIFNSLNIMTVEDDGSISFNAASTGETEPSVEFPNKVGFGNLYSHGASTATISTGSLTVTDIETRVNGEGSVDDDLENITASSYFGHRTIIILRYNGNGAITVKNGTGNITLMHGGDYILNSNNQRLVLLETASGWVELYRNRWEPWFAYREEQTSGTGGGGFTSGAWQTRTLNAEDTDTEALVTRSGNVLTIQPGRYRCFISAPANGVDEHQIRLRNTSDATTALEGTAELAPTGTQTRSFIDGEFTLAAAKNFEVQHRCTTTNGTDGFGVSTGFGENEVFTMATFVMVN